MALNKEKLKEYHDVLNNHYGDYMIAYRLWKNGSNIQKRDKGFADAEMIISRVQNIIEKEEILYNLAMEPENFYDGFMSTRYFDRDMPRFLQRLSDSLKAFN